MPITTTHGQPLMLAASTSSRQGSLCLMQGHKILYTDSWQIATHSEYIVPAYQKMLRTTQLKPHKIQAYALDIGPGSFTGLRVGVNFIRSLAYLFDKNIYTLNSMQILALEVFETQPQTTVCGLMIDAFKNQIYNQFFVHFETNTTRHNRLEPSHPTQTQTKSTALAHEATKGPCQALSPPQCVEATQIAKTFDATAATQTQLVCAGNGWTKYKDIFLPSLQSKWKYVDLNNPQADVLARWALRTATPIKWPELKPFYMRPSSAEENFRSATQPT